MITVTEIARKAGISIGTVDRVIHGRGRVADATARRVMRIVKTAGYTPNVFARNLVLGRAYTVGVLLPRSDQDSGYWELVADGVRRAATDLSAYRVSAVFARYDRYSRESFAAACSRLGRASVDAVLIAPVSPGLVEPYVRKLPQTMPCAFVDSTIPGLAPLFFVGQDSYGSGRLAARLMHLVARERGSVAVLRIQPDDLHIRARADGFGAFCAERGSLTTVPFDMQGNVSAKDFGAVVDRIVSAVTDVRGVFVTNAHTHHVASCLRKRGMAGALKIVGYDVVAESVPFIRDGTIDFVISQRPQAQGYEGMRSFYRHFVLKQAPEARQAMPFDIVTAENVDHHAPGGTESQEGYTEGHGVWTQRTTE